MFPFPFAARGLLAVALLGAAGLTLAAPVAPTPRIDPLDPDAPTRSLPYRSVWHHPSSLTESEPVDWRAAHTAVQKAGGWRVYAREIARENARENAREARP
jgi:hypothetical protein